MLVWAFVAVSTLWVAAAGKVSQDELLALINTQQDLINRLEQKVGILEDDVEYYKARVVELELIVESDDVKNPTKPMATMDTRISPRAECQLGNQFEFAEFVDHFSPGPPMPMFSNLPYECLLECISDKECVTVNMAPIGDVFDCLKYYNNTSEPVALAGWNSYKVIDTESCFVAQPDVYFQAGLCQSSCYPENTTIPWNIIRANTSQDMGPDGIFTCPVSGFYLFTLDILTFSTNQADLVVYVDSMPAGKLNIDNSVVSSSNSFSFYCAASSEVKVQTTSVYSSNCIYGSCLTWESNFIGELLTINAESYI